MLKLIAKMFMKLALQEKLTCTPIFCVKTSVTYVMKLLNCCSKFVAE